MGKVIEKRTIVLCEKCNGMGYSYKLKEKIQCQYCDSSGKRVQISRMHDVKFIINDALRSDIKLGLIEKT